MKISYLIPHEELIKESHLLELEAERCSANYKNGNHDTLLFLLPGVTFDTYSLIQEYANSNPIAIVTENSEKFKGIYENVIEVKNARKCFAYAMSQISDIGYESLSFIGVTGTNGKTSTATMIYNVLTEAKIKCGFIGTGKILFDSIKYTDSAYSMTTPDPDILYPIIKDMQKRGCECVVIEASSHALELEKLFPIRFKIGIFTGISHEHLEFHGNMENYFRAKEKLISSSESAIINFDDPYGKKLYEKYKEKSIGVSMVWQSDSNAADIESYGIDGIAYAYRTKNLLTRIRLSLPGLYNVYNSMFAFEASYKMNVCPKVIKDALENTKSIDGRFEIIKGEPNVIIDYAHTPFALESLLKTINSLKNIGQKIILVFGCGGERDWSKRPLMASVAEKLADKIIVTNDNPRSEDEGKIISDILCGFKKETHGVILERELAIRYAITSAEKKDIVVIAGKGHEKYIKDKNGTHEFNEKEIILNSLKLRNKE